MGIGDDALNYWDGSSSSWTNGADKGSSMNAWAITTGGSTGVFTGSPGDNGMSTTNIGTRAFGLYATGGNYVNATAELASAMAVGDELTFYWAINWDANGGGKGFDLKAGGSTVYTVKNSNSQNIAAATGGGSFSDITTDYGTNAMKVTLVRTSSSEYSFTMTKRSSGSYSTTISSSSAINQINFFCGNQNDGDGKRNMYFNKINLVKQTGATYSWSGSLGSDPNPVALPGSTTTYTVTATGSNGCTATDDVVVTLNNSNPTANAGSDVSHCSGSSSSLSASGGVSYSWSPTTGLSDASIAAPTANHTSTTTYTVTATGNNGCTDTDDVVVTVNSLPTASASSSYQRYA
ncbi:MAG: hypothetical protein CM15mP65_18060 [Crocinitomicaceae bacterium]|nr:MAG: hypothetical protein CM15mP65_18060 [Crocinitomicaceae bacterium]